MGNLNPDPSTVLGGNRKTFPRGYLERLGLERRQRTGIRSCYPGQNGVPEE